MFSPRLFTKNTYLSPTGTLHPNKIFDITYCYLVTVNLLIQVPLVSFGASAYMQEAAVQCDKVVRPWRHTLAIRISVLPPFSCVTWRTA